MTGTENLILQGLKLEIATMTAEIQKLAVKTSSPSCPSPLPEWINLETAVSMKGGAAFATYRTKLFLQPCCGLNFKLIGGRKCWRREDVIRWVSITDADLKAYAEEWKVSIPKEYEKRSL